MSSRYECCHNGTELSLKLDCLDLASRVNNGQGGSNLLDDAKKLYEWLDYKPSPNLRVVYND